MKKLVTLSLFLGIFSFSAWSTLAQEPAASPTPSEEEVEKQKATQEKNAYRLLDQVIDEAQSLRSIENRVRVQITTADLLWKTNQTRARSLFSMAADGVTELGRPTTQNPRSFEMDFSNGQFEAMNRGAANRSFQLRQDLVLAVAKHDAALAYQLLAATKPATTTMSTTVDPRGPRVVTNQEENLEQALLGRIAALDPKLAAQNAELMMEKGQFPRSLSEVIRQLQKQDPEAATKLVDKTIKKIQTSNILSNTEAGTLAQTLLILGPRPPASSTSTTEANTTPTPQGRVPVLEQSQYVELLGSMIEAALKATPQTQNQRTNQMGGRTGPGRGIGPGVSPTPPPAPSDSQIEQNNARRLLSGLVTSLPMIDQYAPGKSAQLRQKMTEIGISATVMNAAQSMSTIQSNQTSASLLQAAAAAPQQVQSRIYQQAAYKAIEEGNSDLARQIANNNLQTGMKEAVLKRVEYKELATNSANSKIDDIRQSLAKLPNENERLTLLLHVANEVEKSNPKLMMQVLDDARQMINRRATNYGQFEQQLRVARAFAMADPARCFEVLDPGISQLNELLQAAAVLSGFETNVFRDGEMSMQAGSGLQNIVSRFGQELATLARSDFERSETLAGRFQFPEPRIMARLAIVQGVLNTSTPAQPANQVRPGLTTVVRD